MAVQGVPATFTGYEVDDDGNAISGPHKFVGSIAYSPPQPPGGGGGGPGDPVHIWGGGNVPMPTPPIANVPGLPPTQNPPGFGLHPAHPIALPGDPWFPPIEPPTEPPTNPPDPNWVWGYVIQAKVWAPVYVPQAGVDPGPKA